MDPIFHGGSPNHGLFFELYFMFRIITLFCLSSVGYHLELQLYALLGHNTESINIIHTTLVVSMHTKEYDIA